MYASFLAPVGHMNQALSSHAPDRRTTRDRPAERLLQPFDKVRITARGGSVQQFAVERPDVTEGRLAQPHRLFEHRVEDRREIAGRGVDDLQDLGGRGLLLQRLAEVAVASRQCPEQTNVLDGDRGLVGEGFDQLDLGGSEGPDLAPPASDDADRPAFAEYRYPEK